MRAARTQTIDDVQAKRRSRGDARPATLLGRVTGLMPTLPVLAGSMPAPRNLPGLLPSIHCRPGRLAYIQVGSIRPQAPARCAPRP